MKIKSSSESVFLFLSLGRPDELDDFWKRKIEDRSNWGIQLDPLIRPGDNWSGFNYLIG